MCAGGEKREWGGRPRLYFYRFVNQPLEMAWYVDPIEKGVRVETGMYGGGVPPARGGRNEDGVEEAGGQVQYC